MISSMMISVKRSWPALAGLFAVQVAFLLLAFGIYSLVAGKLASSHMFVFPVGITIFWTLYMIVHILSKGEQNSRMPESIANVLNEAIASTGLKNVTVQYVEKVEMAEFPRPLAMG